MFTNKDIPSLSNLSSNDMLQYLIGDLIYLLQENIRDYLRKNSVDDIFAQEVKPLYKTLRKLHDKILDSQSIAIENKEDKDYWLLSYLVRDEFAGEALEHYILDVEWKTKNKT